MAKAGSETPFQISISDGDLDLLRRNLEFARFPDELENAQWKYGAPLADMKRLVGRWKSTYDWRKHEKALNDEMPMFTRDIDVDNFGTLNIHYVHKKSKAPNAIPLLFLHGWPGSFYEARKILPLLTAASTDHPSFNVVALSLPGYGFSEAPRKQGFAEKQFAEVAHKVMLSLGYDQYVTQGGDWGHVITQQMAYDYGGKHVKAWHTNMPLGVPPSFYKEPVSYLLSLVKPLSAKEKEGMKRSEWYWGQSSAYFALHSTQPQTLGYSLTDSPVGLLAWIYEKLHVWTDNFPWEDDEVLTWVSIFWFSRGGPAASMRIYYEVQGGKSKTTLGTALYPKIPMGVSFFPLELFNYPRDWIRRGNNIVCEFEHDSGGHFAAHEKPNELVDDVRKMFSKGGGAYGVVPGKDGYA